MTELLFGKLINQLQGYIKMKLILLKFYNNHVWHLDYQDKLLTVMQMFHKTIPIMEATALIQVTPLMVLILVTVVILVTPAMEVTLVTLVIQAMELEHLVEIAMLELMGHVKMFKIKFVMH